MNTLSFSTVFKRTTQLRRANFSLRDVIGGHAFPASLILFGLAALGTHSSDAATLLSDGFGYASGNLGTVGSAGGWSGSSSGVTVSTGNLDGSGLGLAASSGNKVTTTTSSSSGSYNQFGTAVTTNSSYFSFLLKVNSTNGISAAGQVIAGLIRTNSASSYFVDVWLQQNGANTQLGVSKLRNITEWHSSPIATGNTYLVVGKYEFIGGSSNDRVSLWVNPTISEEGDEPSPDVTTTSGGDGSSLGIGRCYIYGGQSADIDELRVATTWAEVVPASGVTPPSTNSMPVVTQALLSPEGLILRGSNGTPGLQFNVVATTNASLPQIQWPVIATHNFDGSGNFDCTNPVAGSASMELYRIRVGNVTIPVAPSITTQPISTTALVGDNPSFSVVAGGTSPLSYQWFFNNSTPLSGKTNATLALSNVQTNDGGGYSVIVANSIGSATSVVATLTVSNILLAPMINTQPQDQIVSEGQTAVFSVVATGTSPLSYQWYFNTNTLLTGRTNATLTLTGVTTNDAGNYSVVITNGVGATNSNFASLTVTPPSTNVDFSHVGFANAGYNVTGGAGGPVVTVTTASDLKDWADSNSNVVIQVSGTIAISGMETHIRPNKTVIGLGSNATLTGGGLYLYRSTNVIIRNLTIKNSSEDNIGVHYSARIWIDHCTLIDSTDGSIDLTQGTDYTTISWCKFYYTSNPPDPSHKFVNLLGASDGESSSRGALHVTFHHNWWSTNCTERMPSVRFGRVHCYNNYYNAPGNNYCVRTRIEAECLVENNFFENVKNPWERYIGGVPGLLRANNNNVGYLDTANGVTWAGGGSTQLIPGTDTVFAPPYSYTLDAAASVPAVVMENAGAGEGPYAP